MEYIYYLQGMKDGEKFGQAIHINKSISNIITSKLELKIVKDAKAVIQLRSPEGKGSINGLALVMGEEYELKMNDQIDMDYVDEHQCFIYTFEHVGNGHQKLDQPPAKKQALNPDEEAEGSWQNIDKKLLIYTPKLIKETNKLACFDLDGTVIKTKSGKRFPDNASDWVFWSPKTTQIINEHASNNFKIVIFTNQMGIGKDQSRMLDFKEKLEKIQKTSKCSMHVYAALKKDYFRKPCIGMYEYLVQEFGPIDFEKSFYVGDAAGRPANKTMKIKKDHSMADRLFAINLGLKFYTPEEFFLKQRPLPFEMPEFDPRDLKSNVYSFEAPNVTEIIIMVGSPGSGKSMFCKRHLESSGYVYVNRDILGTSHKCMVLLDESIKKNQSVVVDNLNRDKTIRKIFVDNAKRLNVQIRCFYMNTSKAQAMHNNKFRELTDNTHAVVADVIIHSFYKYFEEPQLSEGFLDIIKIDFNPDFTEFSEYNKKLYTSFLLDK